jgi:predicted transcriptional regulator
MWSYDEAMTPKPTKEPREVVTCRILPGIIAKLDVAASADSRSRSEMIERAVVEFLDRLDKRKAKK